MNNSVDLLKAHGLLKEVSTKDQRIIAAFKILEKYSDICRGGDTVETHRLALHENEDSVQLHLTPILDRMHALEPETKVTYEFVEDDQGLCLRLTVGPRRFESMEGKTTATKLLWRSMPFIEAFIQANKGSDGCVSCGAGPQEICNASCQVLEAEILLRSMERI